MQNKSRPFLLTGLILSIIAYAALLISSFLTVIPAFTLFSGDEVLDAAVAMILVIGIVLIVFSLLGLIFAAVSISRCRLSAKDFAGKKGLVITTFVFNVIVAVLILIGLFSGFDVLSFIMLLVMILAAVFIMVDVVRNKKYLAEELAQPAQPQPAQPQVEENKEEK